MRYLWHRWLLAVWNGVYIYNGNEILTQNSKTIMVKK
jgi:hypothetical protein